MKRNITSPANQQSLFASDSATAVSPPPRTPRARAIAQTASAAAPVAKEANPKIAKTKIAKTNAAPPPVSKAVPAATPVKAAPEKTSAAVKAAAPVRTSPAGMADGGAKPKIAKTNAQPKKPAPAVSAVRVVNEPVFEGGMLWKMSGRNGVAYIKDAALAGELLSIDPKKLAQAAMAVYYDKKGKAFAWQVRFDTDRWDEVMRRLG